MGRGRYIDDINLPGQAYGAVGALPTMMNAIVNALNPLGVDHEQMPATPEHIWRAINDAA